MADYVFGQAIREKMQLQDWKAETELTSRQKTVKTIEDNMELVLNVATMWE